MKYSYTVIVNNMSYGVTAGKPWTAITRALMKYQKEHPREPLTMLDVYCVNETLVDLQKARQDALDKFRKEQEGTKNDSL